MKLTTTILIGVAVLASPGAAQAANLVTDVAVPSGVAQTAQSFDVATVDYNGDGAMDYLYSPQNGPGRQLYRNNGDGTFTIAATLAGSLTTDQHDCRWADVDHNGLVDAYCTLGATGGRRVKANSLFLQTSPGTFTDTAITAGVDDPVGRGRSAIFLDANADGWLDLYVVNYGKERVNGVPAPNRFFLNRGADPAGAWLGYQAAPEWGAETQDGDRGCAFSADMNGDARPDLVYCGIGGVKVWLNTGSSFTASTAAFGAGFAAADLELADVNGDGIRDAVFVRLRQTGVRLGTASGTYAPASQLRTLTAGRDLAVADFTGDGVLDVYVLQGNGAPGCTSCATNYPDTLLVGTVNGKLTPLAGVPQASTGSGDLAEPLVGAPGSRPMILVANGANLRSGPVQLLRVGA